MNSFLQGDNLPTTLLNRSLSIDQHFVNTIGVRSHPPNLFTLIHVLQCQLHYIMSPLETAR